MITAIVTPTKPRLRRDGVEWHCESFLFIPSYGLYRVIGISRSADEAYRNWLHAYERGNRKEMLQVAGVNNRSGALAHIDDDVILGRIRAGEHASRIADELGVHKSAISHRYADKPEYLLARRLGTEVRLDEAEKEITESADQFNLARARERFRAVAWRAEREFPDRWGTKTQVTGDLSITVQINRGITIEGEVGDADVSASQQLTESGDNALP